jgi:hypothetical protein
MFIFPAHILTPATVQRRVVGQTISGGQALDGDEDVIATDGGGRWRVEYSGIQLVDARATRVWEAWLDYLQSGVTVVLVPLLSLATSPRPGVAPERVKLPSALYVDNPEWPTEMRYALPDHVAEIAADADLRATRLTFDVTKGPAISSGQAFQVGDRAYRTVRPDGDEFIVAPPLRAPIVAGANAVFDFPMVRAKLAPGQDFSSPLFRGKYGSVDVSFLEAV